MFNVQWHVHLSISHSVQNKQCLFINLKDSQMKLYSLTLKSFGTRQLFNRLSCKYPVLHIKHICGMQCSCKLQKNCNLGFWFFFCFSLGLLAIEKDSKRNVQCSVVFSPFLVLHAVVFYFSYGLDISKFYRIRRENSCVLGVNSPYLGFQILIHIIFNWGAWNNLKPEQMLHLMFLFGWGFLVYFDLLLKIQNGGEISARKNLWWKIVLATWKFE